MEKILVLDFGSQTTALIGRRLREMGVFAEIKPGEVELSQDVLKDVLGIILSGSPASVYNGGPAPRPFIYECGLPLLGICYGLQRMNVDSGGLVERLKNVEYGAVEVSMEDGGEPPRIAESAFLNGFPKKTFRAWMSHADTLSRLADGFTLRAKSASGFPAVVTHNKKNWFGVQFHPEATHCECGNDILASFAFNVCKCNKTWSVEKYADEAVELVKKQAGGKTVLLLISGGVDSMVCGALLLKALPNEKTHLMYIDTGLMRKGETEEVLEALALLNAKNTHIARAGDLFLNALKGKSDPEEKRKIIGDLFITVQEAEVAKLKLPGDYLLAQGTLYTDMIESGKGCGKNARVIKSHHNVASPLVAAKREKGLIIEPLSALYKDEVRALGRILGLADKYVMRHPFPGPGLAVRVMGEVTKEKLDALREADAVFINELKKRRVKDGSKTLYDDIWQAFAVLLKERSVGVAGDERKYGFVAALRAVASADGMSADVYPFNINDLIEISTAITNAVKEIGRVTYDVSSKPPASIEWE
ncbi:MAG: glutamine-hydrolyzing GMP synthase [Spirochaetaceae bacterium]|jgi:GMP synthase (glutamine-hydrolysing)|nr:glutamine-hydrolyzing GMP synthase [Spirochaetaceae bacterium]